MQCIVEISTAFYFWCSSYNFGIVQPVSMARSKASKGKARKAGKFLPLSEGVAHESVSPRRPFVVDKELDHKVAEIQGMGASAPVEEKGVYIDFDINEHLQGLKGGEKEKMKNLGKVVKAAVEAAIPSIILAVKEAFLVTVKEEVNPLLLHSQFVHDQLDQNMRKENLRLAGVAEAGDESKEVLAGKILQVAKEAGVELSPNDIDTCHRIGTPPRPVTPIQNGQHQEASTPKPRQVFVRFFSRRKRDEVYDSRFKLKGKDLCKGVFINEDLTPLRYKLLMAAKKAPDVKTATSKYGNIVCKMNDDTYKTLRTVDDLFDVGLTNVKYDNFGLNIL